MDKVDQRIDNVEHLLEHHYTYDIYKTETYQTFSDKAHSDGWKLSIQGKSTEDALYLYNRLVDFLDESQTAYKLATSCRFAHEHPEQSKKAMTIYIRNDWSVKDFAEEVYSRITDYTGHEGIKCPTSYEHYKGGVYFRNDRDENGNYITAN